MNKKEKQKRIKAAENYCTLAIFNAVLSLIFFMGSGVEAAMPGWLFAVILLYITFVVDVPADKKSYPWL